MSEQNHAHKGQSRNIWRLNRRKDTARVFVSAFCDDQKIFCLRYNEPEDGRLYIAPNHNDGSSANQKKAIVRGAAVSDKEGLL